MMSPRHVWFIVRSWYGGPWEIHGTGVSRGEIRAYRTRKAAAQDLCEAKRYYHAPPQERVKLVKVELP